MESPVLIAGSVLLDGSGLITATTTGKGIAWARTGAGTYTATITEGTTGNKYPKIISAVANVRDAGDNNAKVISIVDSTGVVTIETTTTASAADIADATIDLIVVAQQVDLD